MCVKIFSKNVCKMFGNTKLNFTFVIEIKQKANKMSEQIVTYDVNPKSATLTQKEMKKFQKFLSEYLSIAAAARAIGIDRQKLDRFILAERSSPETIEKIRTALTNQ
jgi:hypothetical protein